MTEAAEGGETQTGGGGGGETTGGYDYKELHNFTLIKVCCSICFDLHTVCYYTNKIQVYFMYNYIYLKLNMRL